MSRIEHTGRVERWGIFELELKGPSAGNPFREVSLCADFRRQNRVVPVSGFYDGQGCYRIRFMPDSLGEWQFLTRSSAPELNGLSGQFSCIAPTAETHGPVRIRDTYHFTYEDGCPYRPFGTTCYVWNHQGDKLEEQTLASLKSSPFNKIRMCVFPKDYDFSKNEPERHAFERSPDGSWDYARFNPEFFQHLEKRIGQLLALGIEADLILFHPYDRWGYAKLPAPIDDAYLRYLVARLAPYRNIWWSIANEYDLMKDKTMADFDRFFRIVQECDPWQHLRSIHHCSDFYDHSKPWVTHLSVQRHDLQAVVQWRETYHKPVVVDECCYEGNVNHSWGNITAAEMTRRFWEGFVRGGYVGHGETYLDDHDVLWWSKGGVLKGESPARIAFLRKIIEQLPRGLESKHAWQWALGRCGDDVLLYYYGIQQPAFNVFELPAGFQYQAEIIDTWNMTLQPLPESYSGKCRINLPGKQYIAVRFTRL